MVGIFGKSILIASLFSGSWEARSPAESRGTGDGRYWTSEWSKGLTKIASERGRENDQGGTCRQTDGIIKCFLLNFAFFPTGIKIFLYSELQAGQLTDQNWQMRECVFASSKSNWVSQWVSSNLTHSFGKLRFRTFLLNFHLCVWFANYRSASTLLREIMRMPI